MACRLLLLAALIVGMCGCWRPAAISHVDQAEHALRQGQYSQAIQLAHDALVERPDNSKAYLVRGRAYQCRNAQGDLDLALADFNEAVRLAPDSPEAYYSRALAHRDRGDLQSASADDATAHNLDPRVRESDALLPETPRESTIDLDAIYKSAAEETQRASEKADTNREHTYSEMQRPRSSGGSTLSPTNSLRESTDAAINRQPEATKKTDPFSMPDDSPFARYLELTKSREVEPTRPATIGPAEGAAANDPRSAAQKRASAYPPSLSSPNYSAPGFSPLNAPAMSQFSTPASPWHNPREAVPADGAQRVLPPGSVQSPFRQPAPRPTGWVEPPGARSAGQQPVQSPFSPAPPRIPNARQFDLEP